MPEYHRALVFLLLISVAVYGLSARLKTEELPGAYALRRNLWFALIIAAFLLGNFWVFSFLALALLLSSKGRDKNVPALFLSLLFVAPPAQR